MKPLFIVNPRSGGGLGVQQFDEARGLIQSTMGEFDVRATQGPRHAVTLAYEAALEGRELIVAVGGDGSIHEVATGILDAKSKSSVAPRLGIFGQGTGGDLRRTLGIEHRVSAYVSVLAKGRARPIDVGRFSCEGHAGDTVNGYFVNILSAGLGGLVDQYVATTSKALGGSLAYLWSSVRALAQGEVGVLVGTAWYKGSSRSLELRTRQIAICNGKYFGGGMKVAPMAEVDDGCFHVVDLGAGDRVEFALKNLKVYSGSHVHDPAVTVFPCDRIEFELVNVSARERFLLDVDGEPLGRPPLRIDLLPKALEVMVP